MANEEHLQILKQGVDTWNRWREENPDVKPDLYRASLSEVNLSKANFREANLRDANLVWANLTKANLYLAALTRADLLWAKLISADLRHTELNWVNLAKADLSGAKLQNADLSNARLVETNLEKADLTNCRVYGIAAWRLGLEGTTLSNLIITRHDEPTITVDSLEVAQFVYLILNRQKLRSVLNAVMEKGVLILGRFGDGGIDVLQAVARRLREMDYVPIIFDFERPPNRNYTQTIQTLAGLSRFVIVDLSGPSVPQELYATVPHYKIPFVPIIETGRKEYSLFVDLLEYDNVLKPIVEFASPSELVEMLPARIVKPAEEKHRDRQTLLEQLFNR